MRRVWAYVAAVALLAGMAALLPGGGAVAETVAEGLSAGMTEQNNMIGKSVFGYQSWFRAGSVGGVTGNDWFHWRGGVSYQDVGGDTTTSRTDICFEMWPDVSDYKAAGIPLRDARTMNLPASVWSTSELGNGGVPELFSSADPRIIDTHFKWLDDYGLHGMAVQRFYGYTSSNSVSQWRHLSDIAASAEKYNKFFYVMYDMSGAGSSNVSNIVNRIKNDWTNEIEGRNVTGTSRSIVSSPAYAHADGKPVVCFWGLSEKSTNYPVRETMMELLEWFHERGYFVIGGVEDNDWANDETDYMDVYKNLDMLSPWMVGRTGFPAQWKRDAAWLEANNGGARHHYYQPVIYPGFGWGNLKPQDMPNFLPRRAGKFAWDQMRYTLSYNFDSLYFAMFDEYDEATAWMKAASDYFDVPTGNRYFQTLSLDGSWLSSDFYLRLASDIASTWSAVMKGEMSVEDVPGSPPTLHALGPVWYRNSFEMREHTRVQYTGTTLLTMPLDPCAKERFPLYRPGSEAVQPAFFRMLKPAEEVGTQSGDYVLAYDGKVQSLDDYGQPVSRAVSYTVISDANFIVQPDMTLEFSIYPLDDNGQYAYIDLLFEDDRLLSQKQTTLAGHQYESGRWTDVQFKLTEELVGEKVVGVVAAYNHVPEEDSTFACYFDDIFIQTTDAEVTGEYVPPPQVDYGAMEEKIAQAEDIWELSTYIRSSVDGLNAGLDAARLLRGFAESQAEADAATARLDAAIKALRLRGDVNGEGRIDSTDARMVLQQEVNLLTLTGAAPEAADVNGDETIDSTDARMILQFEVGLLYEFP